MKTHFDSQGVWDFVESEYTGPELTAILLNNQEEQLKENRKRMPKLPLYSTRRWRHDLFKNHGSLKSKRSIGYSSGGVPW